MRMVLVICLCRSLFSYSYSDLKKWCHGDISCATSVPVVHRSTACPVIPPCLLLMALLIVNVGDLADVTLGSQRLVVAPIPRVPSAGGATQGVAGIGVLGADPQLGDDTGSSLRDLVIRGVGVGVPGSAVPSDLARTPRSTGAMGLEVS
jgi:hypothetical protein